MMIEEALTYYAFHNPETVLLRHNENMTYQVKDEEGSYVLRIHKPVDGFQLELLRMGKSPLSLIQGEMAVLDYLGQYPALGTQQVIRNKQGHAVTLLPDGTPLTVLRWVNGDTLETVPMKTDLAYGLGEMLGRLHRILSGMPRQVIRYGYDGRLLARMHREAATAERMGHLTPRQYGIVEKTLVYMQDSITVSSLPNLLVHADLGKSNLLYDGTKLIPIDFSLSGYSLPEMDISSAFGHINDVDLNREVLRGYRAVSRFSIDEKQLDVFMCFQVLLFVLCQHMRIAGEAWFPLKMEGWCEEHFLPLISAGQISPDLGLYQ